MSWGDGCDHGEVVVVALGFISGAWICNRHPLMANHLPSLKQGSSTTRDGRTGTLCWDHARSWDSRTWFSRSPGQDWPSFSHPFPLLLHTLPGTSFSQPREPSRPTSSPSLFLSFPKLTQVQHWLLGRGMEPGNFSQNKGNFGARWDQLQNLWNLAVAGEGPTAPSHF